MSPGTITASTPRRLNCWSAFSNIAHDFGVVTWMSLTTPNVIAGVPNRSKDRQPDSIVTALEENRNSRLVILVFLSSYSLFSTLRMERSRASMDSQRRNWTRARFRFWAGCVVLK